MSLQIRKDIISPPENNNNSLPLKGRGVAVDGLNLSIQVKVSFVTFLSQKFDYSTSIQESENVHYFIEVH